LAAQARDPCKEGSVMAANSQAFSPRRSMSHPGGRSMRHFFRELFQSLSRDDIFGHSAQLAYYFFFAIFPGFIFLSTVAGIFSSAHGMRDTLMHYLGRVVPPQAYDLLQGTFSQSDHSTGRLTFGVLVALWSANVGMSAVCDTLNAVHDIEEGRPWWKVQLNALGLTLVTALLLLCALGALFVGDIVIHSAGSGSLSGVVWILIKIAQYALALVLVALIFAITYFWAPDMKDRVWHWITPGATVGIILWVIASVGLRVYLHYFNSYSATYGSIGAVMILLLWFYIAGCALLIGAEINAVNEDIAAHQGDPQAAAKGEKGPKAA
jgi:membrane protein